MYIYDGIPASELIAKFNPVSGLYRNKAGTAAFKAKLTQKDLITTLHKTLTRNSVKAGAASSKRKPDEARKIAAFIKKEIRKDPYLNHQNL